MSIPIALTLEADNQEILNSSVPPIQPECKNAENKGNKWFF